MSRGFAPNRPVRILCVCTGNVCRSPAAEQLLAVALGSAADVESMGTGAVIGAEVSPPMRRLLGPDPRGDGFRARQLTARAVESADLVLTMADEHTGAVVEEAPRAVRRTFRLKELAWLLRNVPPAGLGAGDLIDRLQAATVAAASRRRPVLHSSSFDVADPYGRDDFEYARAFDDIAVAVDSLARVLQPATYLTP